MKKMFVMLVAMLTMAICSVCSATPGKVLDAEDAMVAKMFAAKDYKSVEAMFTPEFKQDFDAKSFDNFNTGKYTYCRECPRSRPLLCPQHPDARRNRSRRTDRRTYNRKPRVRGCRDR